MTTTDHERETLLGLLARGDRDRVRELANTILARLAEQGGDFSITRDPVAGVLATQVREPLSHQRFLVGDILVSQAEVTLRGEPGWGMCFGEDLATALALAICDAEVARGGELAAEIRQLAHETGTRLREARAEEWQRLQPTIVEFEEIS